jgi:hypothetical protein
MLRRVVSAAGVTAWCLMLLMGLSRPVMANPNDYPQYAQQQVDPAIAIAFIGVDQAKEALDAGRQQLFVDVRTFPEYSETHLPKAVSIPLGVLSVRMTEIPRDIPVVLY